MTDAAVHPLLARLAERGLPLFDDLMDYEAFRLQPGRALVMLAERPERVRETLDLAVIFPELLAACDGPLRAAVLMPALASEVAKRHGVRKFPALLALSDGAFTGAIEGLLDWSDYLAATSALLQRDSQPADA